MGQRAETRDLLAERLRRLEDRITELGERIAATGEHMERATHQLDALVGLVGRLGRVVDVQGNSLQDDEDQLERKLGLMDHRVAGLAQGLHSIASRLDALGADLDSRPHRRDAPNARHSRASSRSKPKR